MRVWSLLCLVGGLSLVGCDSSEPVAGPSKPSAPATTKHEDDSTDVSPNRKTSGDATDEPAPTADADGTLTLDRLAFAVPEGWQRKPVASTFILAEFALPKAEGDDADGRLTVSVAGGSVEANVGRWRDQFGGKPEKETEDKRKVGDLDVTIVDFTGEFNDQRGPFAPPTKRANHRMLAAVIPVNGELHFIKATGSQATIAAHADRFHEFVGSATKK